MQVLNTALSLAKLLDGDGSLEVHVVLVILVILQEVESTEIDYESQVNRVVISRNASSC